MSADRKRASSRGAGGDGTSAWAILHELLAATIGDARRADVLLSSALGASDVESPPTSADAVLWFAKTHLLPFSRDEIGARAAVSLIARLESRLSALPPTEVKESARRRRDERDTLPAPPLAPPTPSVLPPFRKKMPSITGDERRPVALLVGANALERSALARALVQAGLDVRSIETAHALATMLADTPAVRIAIVDLDRDDAQSIVSTLAESRPDLPVVARTARGEPLAAARDAGMYVVYTYVWRHPPPDAIERICEYAMREDAASRPSDRGRGSPG